MKSKLILLIVLVLGLSSVASASIITGVTRSRGTSGNRAPIGAFLHDTAPMASPSGLADGAPVYSDRTYTFTNTPWQLVGDEYVRTFNTDKHNKNILVNYFVTIGEPTELWIAMDDRIPEEYDADGGFNEFVSQQEAVDLVVHQWAAAGLFVDTGLDVFIAGDNDRQMSVYKSPTLSERFPSLQQLLCLALARLV